MYMWQDYFYSSFYYFSPLNRVSIHNHLQINECNESIWSIQKIFDLFIIYGPSMIFLFLYEKAFYYLSGLCMKGTLNNVIKENKDFGFKS